MFLPDATNIRSPTPLAPVVRPTSCWIEPRYSTLPDITASGGGDAADAGVAMHSAGRVARLAVRSDLILWAGTQPGGETGGPDQGAAGTTTSGDPPAGSASSSNTGDGRRS